MHLLFWIAWAIPFLAYDQVGDNPPDRVGIDFDSTTKKLVVGTNLNYVEKVADAANWVGLTPVDFPLAQHHVYGWKKDTMATGVFVSHRTNNKTWNTYVPDVDDIAQITEETLASLTRLYERVSANPAAMSGDLIRFMIPPDVEQILGQPNPGPRQLQKVQTAQSILGVNLAFVEREAEKWDFEAKKRAFQEEFRREFQGELKLTERAMKELEGSAEVTAALKKVFPEVDFGRPLESQGVAPERLRTIRETARRLEQENSDKYQQIRTKLFKMSDEYPERERRAVESLNSEQEEYSKKRGYYAILLSKMRQKYEQLTQFLERRGIYV